MCNYRQLNTGAGVVCGWCLAYCTGVVLNTVRESANLDSKEDEQADAGSRRFRRHFLCGALLCNFSSTEHEGLSYLHMSNGNVQRNLLCAAFCHKEFSHLAPVLAYDFLSRCKFSTPTSTLLYSSVIRLYPQNPVFKIVHDKSVKVYLPMYNGNVQQNPLCVESCVIKKFSMSPLFSSTIFYSDANSVLLRAHLCPAVDSMRRKPFVRFFIKMQLQYSY